LSRAASAHVLIPARTSCAEEVNHTRAARLSAVYLEVSVTTLKVSSFKYQHDT
jgi:hypothetical protein